MNESIRQQLINTNLRNCFKIGTKYDLFDINKSESLEYNLEMARQFTILRYEGFCVSVRPVLLNGNKPDLVILDLPKPMIKEIMFTEKEDRFLKKDYLGINKIKVKVEKSK